MRAKVVGATAFSFVAVAFWMAGPAVADPVCTVSWTGAAGDGAWTTSGNWSTGAVPSATDVACVPAGQTVSVGSGAAQAATVVAGGATIQVAGGSLQLSDPSQGSTIGTLQLSSGQLSGAASVTVTGSLTWTGGTMGGSGSTVIASGATATIEPTSSNVQPVLDGRILVNDGDAVFNCATATDPTGVYGEIDALDQAQIDNASGATMVFKGNESSFGAPGTGCALHRADGSVDVFHNSGLLDLQSSDDVMGWQFANDDSATVLFDYYVGATYYGGELELYGGQNPGTWLGGVWKEAGTGYDATVSLSAGGTYRFSGSSQLELNVGLDVGRDPAGNGSSYVQFAQWLAGNSTPPALQTGDINWPDGSIGADGPVTIGDGSAEAVVASLRAGGPTTVNEPAGVPPSPWNIDVLTVEAPTTLNGGVSISQALVTAGGGPLNMSGGDHSIYRLELDGSSTGRGVLTEPGSLTVTNFVAGGGVLSGGGTTTVTNTVTEGSSNGCASGPGLVLDGQKLVNEGAFDLSWPTYGENGAEIDNRGTLQGDATCAFVPSPPGSLVAAPGADQPVLVNEAGGSMTSVASHPTFVGWTVENSGSMQSGGFTFGGNTSGSGFSGGGTSSGGSSGGYGGGSPGSPNRPVPSCADPVDCATGDQYEQQVDLTLAGRGGGFQLQRTYNSQLAASQVMPGPFGYGWTGPFDTRLWVDRNHGAAAVQNGNGSVVPFTINSDGSFSPGPGVQATLTQNPDGTYSYLLPDQHTMTFDSTGNLVSDADRTGNKTVFGYNSQGQVTTITAPSSRQIALTYNSQGLVASATDPAGLTVDYSYSDASSANGPGELLQVSDSSGLSQYRWKFTYDSQHELLSMTDANGHTTTDTYQSLQVASQTDPLGRKTTWAYSPGETDITSPDGNITKELFDANGDPTAITYGAGTPQQSTKAYTYDASLEPLTITDGDEHVTSYTYDAAGDRTSQADPSGHTTSWTYDAQHDVLTKTLPSGAETTYTYDSTGHLTGETQTLTGQSNQAVTTSFSYNSAGDRTASTDPLGQTTTYTYDQYGDLAGTTDPAGDEATYGYDADGRRTSMVCPLGNVTGADPSKYTTAYSYDPLGELLAKTDPLGSRTSYSYDPAGNRVSSTDADGHTTTYTFDAANELTTIKRADGSTESNSYDVNGNPTAQTDGAGHTTSYTYDPLNRVASTTDPLNRTTSYTYDAAGNRITVTDPAGRTTTYGYDPANQLTSIKYSDGKTPNVSYGYDKDGNRTSMTDATGTTTYAYDSLDRLTTKTNGAGKQIAYSYDLDGNITSITYPNAKTITRTFDRANRLHTVTDWFQNTTSFAYDANSNLISTAFPATSGDVDSYTFNRADQVTNVAYGKGSTQLAAVSYTRDADGQVLTETQTGLPGAASTTYSYTSLNQIGAAGTSKYSYDAADDVTQLAGTTGYAYDAANELTASPSTTYTYDKLGERTTMIQTKTTAYSYDQDSRLASVTPPKGSATTFAYDGDGQRTSETTGTTTSSFVWDEAQNLLTDGSISYIYGPGALPIEQIDSGGNPTYLHHDQLGSTRLLTSASGSLVASYSYNPYGSLAGQTGTASTALRWAGQYQDTATSLYYLRARYYDPTTGQFLTRDPQVTQTREAYAYAQDNPTNVGDPTGLNPYSDFAQAYFPVLLADIGAAQNSVGGALATVVNSPFTGLPTLLGEIHYGAPTDEGGAQLTFEIGMVLYYNTQATIASDLNDVTALAQYQSDYQGAIATVGGILAGDALAIYERLSNAAGITGLLKAILSTYSLDLQDTTSVTGGGSSITC